MTNVATASSTDSFIYTSDPSQAPTVTANVNAAIVNAFYVVNSIHDISYLYGFTEAAFNFQNDNQGKGGKGNDRVTISVQDSAGTDNADFSTPADGTSGRMRMFLWDLTNVCGLTTAPAHSFTHIINNPNVTAPSKTTSSRTRTLMVSRTA